MLSQARERWDGFSIRTKARAIIALPLLAFLIALAGLAVLAVEQREANVRRQESARIGEQLQQVLGMIVDEETACRGYVLTGLEEFLEPYERAQNQVPRRIAQLESELKTSPENLELFDKIVRDIHEKTSIVDSQIQEKRARIAIAPQRVQQGLVRGKHVMDRIRVDIAALSDRVSLTLERRNSRIRTIGRWATFGCLSAMLVSVVVSAIALRLLIASVIGRVQTLEASAAKVASGLAPDSIALGSDEIGRLGAALQSAGKILAQREAAARQAAAQAEQASRAKSEFLSRMSHELRTPMNSILGFAQLLEQDKLSPDQSDSVEQILTSGRHLLRLIDYLLQISSLPELDKSLLGDLDSALKEQSTVGTQQQ